MECGMWMESWGTEGWELCTRGKLLLRLLWALEPGEKAGELFRDSRMWAQRKVIGKAARDMWKLAKGASVEAVRELATVGEMGPQEGEEKARARVYASWAAVRRDLEPMLGGLWKVFRVCAEMVPCKKRC